MSNPSFDNIGRPELARPSKLDVELPVPRGKIVARTPVHHKGRSMEVPAVGTGESPSSAKLIIFILFAIWLLSHLDIVVNWV